jgi:hypothetical protein
MYFDYVLLRTKFSVMYSSNECLRNNISDLKYFYPFYTDYRITRDHKIIGLIINDFANQCVWDIFCSEEGLYSISAARSVRKI